MPITLEQTPYISQGDVDVVAIDFTPLLDGSEVLTGTPTTTEVTTTALTFGNQGVNLAALTILRRTVAIGKAVQFKVSGQQSGTTYRVRVSVATNSTPPRTIVRDLLLACV